MSEAGALRLSSISHDESYNIYDANAMNLYLSVYIDQPNKGLQITTKGL
jgi:hypothetical protein